MARESGPRDWSPSMKDVQYAVAEKCLVIMAADWFVREDFQAWRRKSHVATWKEKDVEGQDVFIVYADDELDWHTNEMPADIYRKILRMVAAVDMEYGVIWIKAV